VSAGKDYVISGEECATVSEWNNYQTSQSPWLTRTQNISGAACIRRRNRGQGKSGEVGFA